MAYKGILRSDSNAMRSARPIESTGLSRGGKAHGLDGVDPDGSEAQFHNPGNGAKSASGERALSGGQVKAFENQAHLGLREGLIFTRSSQNEEGNNFYPGGDGLAGAGL